MDINNLGTFSSIAAVWAKYPEGGHEGDYLYVNSVKWWWDKYERRWTDSDTDGGPYDGTSRYNTTHDGNVIINNNLIVAGTIRCKGLKSYDCGWFSTASALSAKYPSPEVGMWAVVGDNMTLYRCETAGTWTNTGSSISVSIDHETMTTLGEHVTAAEQNITQLEDDLNYFITETYGGFIEQYQSDLSETNASITALQTRVGNLETSDEQQNTEIVALQGRLNVLEPRMNTAEQNITQLEDSFSYFETDVYGVFVTQYESDKSEITGDISGLQTRMSEAERLLGVADEEIQGAIGRLNELEPTVAAKADASAVTTLSERVDELAEYISDTSELETRVTNLTTRVTGVETAVSTLNSSFSGISTQFTTLRTSVSNLSTDVSNLSSRFTTTETNLTTLAARVGVNEADIVSLKGRMTSAEEAIATKASASDLTSVSNRTTSLEGRATTLEGRADSLEERATSLEGRAQNLEGRATTLEDEMDEAQADIESLEGRATTNEGEITATKARVQALEDAAVEANYIEQTATSMAIRPNVLNHWGAIEALALTFLAGASNRINEYMLEFQVSGSNFGLTLPNGVRWSEEEPEWADGSTYQVSILNNMAIAAEWEAA